jgi:hypothetical protein
MRRQFIVSMVAGMLGAALFAAGPAAVAAIGDAVRIGQINSGNARTTVRGNTDGALAKVVNTSSGDTALQLVSDGPNLKVSNSKRIKRLNADRIDGFHANQLIRAAHTESDDLPDGDGSINTLLSVDIVAPAPGVLLISAGAHFYIDGFTGVSFGCWIDLDAVTTLSGSSRGSHDNDNSQGHCATSVGVGIAPGNHTVEFRSSSPSGIDIGPGSLTVLWVPFDGNGAVPDYVNYLP